MTKKTAKKRPSKKRASKKKTSKKTAKKKATKKKAAKKRATKKQSNRKADNRTREDQRLQGDGSDYWSMIEEPVDMGGRPRIEIDFDLLEKLCMLHCTAEECAGVFGCSVDTLDRRIKEAGYAGFAEYIKQFASHAKVSLRRMQWRKAEGGNVGMLIWLGKQYLGQKDKIEESTDPDAPKVTMIKKIIVDP